MRLQEHVDHLALFDDAPRVEHRDAIADLLDHIHLVCDQHDGQPEFAIDALEQIQNGARGFGVERGRRLIGQQHLRLARERARNADTLLLPAADLRRIAVLLRGKPDQIEQRQHRRFDLGALHARELERQRDVIEYRARRQQIEVLEDHADLAARLAQLARGHRRQIAAADQDITFSRPRQQVDRAHQCTFAGAAAADDAEYFARRNGQIDVVQRFDPAPRPCEALRNSAKFDHEKNGGLLPRACRAPAISAAAFIRIWRAILPHAGHILLIIIFDFFIT
jgi:hypothetical protein